MTCSKTIPFRYICFVCEQYYPSGGWGDFVGGGNNLAELETIERWKEVDHIVDLTTMEVVDDYDVVKK